MSNLSELIESVIESKYVNLRALEENDLPILRNWRNKDFVRKATREFRLLNMINQKHWFESIHVDNPPKMIMFGIENKKNSLIGLCGLTYIDWKNKHAEISIIFSKKNWQTTKETKNAIDLLLKYGFDELNLHRIWAEIFDSAPENIKLFKRMDFVKEGVLRQKLWRGGKWYDSSIYAKLTSK